MKNKKEFAFWLVITLIVPTLTSVYFLNGWNTAEEQIKQLKIKNNDQLQ